MSKITNFKISVSDQDLKDLHSRLSNTRWPNKETVKDWNQGIPLSYMKEICAYWLEEYNFQSLYLQSISQSIKLHTYMQFK